MNKINFGLCACAVTAQPPWNDHPSGGAHPIQLISPKPMAVCMHARCRMSTTTFYSKGGMKRRDEPLQFCPILTTSPLCLKSMGLCVVGLGPVSHVNLLKVMREFSSSPVCISQLCTPLLLYISTLSHIYCISHVFSSLYVIRMISTFLYSSSFPFLSLLLNLIYTLLYPSLLLKISLRFYFTILYVSYSLLLCITMIYCILGCSDFEK